MAVPTVTVDPAPPTGVSATPLAIPLWPFATGTWYYRIAQANASVPPLSKLSSASAEQSFVVAAGQTVFFSATGTSGNWMLIYLTQTSGDYSGAALLVVTATNASAAQFAPSGSWIVGFTGGAASLVAFDHSIEGLPNLVATGGTEADPITIAGIASAYDPGGSVILRPPDAAFPAGENPGPFLFPGALLIGDVGATATYLRMGAETVACRGGFFLNGNGGGINPTNVHVEAGTKTVDGARIDGPTIVILGSNLTSGAKLPQYGSWNFYAGAFVDASADVVAGAAGSPNPWNGWTPDFVPAAGIRFIPIDAVDHGMESIRFANFGSVDVVPLVAGPTTSFDRVGLHDVAIFVASGTTLSDVRAEQTDDGLQLEKSIGGNTLRLDTNTVLDRTNQDVVFTTAQTVLYLEILDCLFLDAVDNNDPIVKLFGLSFRSDTGSPSRIDVMHRADVTVYDAAGAPVPGATVRFLAPDGTELFSDTTDSEGAIGTAVLVRESYAPNQTAAWWSANFPTGVAATLSGHVAAGRAVKTSNTPIRLVVERDGFLNESIPFTLDGPIAAVVTNHPDGYTTIDGVVRADVDLVGEVNADRPASGVVGVALPAVVVDVQSIGPVKVYI